MIRGKCKGQRGKWPTAFAAVPRVSDYVEGETEDGGFALAQVVSVTHATTTSHDRAMNRDYIVPLIVVMLK